MRALARTFCVFAAAALLLSACGGDDGEADAKTNASVAVKDDFFEPEKTTIAVGDSVTWTWEGTNPHNVSSDGFNSKIQTEGTYSFSFDEAGTIDYICTVHPSMKASIVVTEM